MKGLIAISENRSCEITPYFEGNNICFKLHEEDCEIKADIVMSPRNTVRIWGQILGCNGEPVKDALVKLLMAEYFHGEARYESIAHTVSDCGGFYQFDIEYSHKDRNIEFKVIAGKTADDNNNDICIDINE